MIRDDLDGKLSLSLQALEADLTKARAFDHAEAVVAYRESLPIPGASAASVKRADSDDSAPAGATKDKPFINSLGMKFVPVPKTGVLFCIHEVRWRDYAEYAQDNANVHPGWKKQDFDGFTLAERPEDHPVGTVNWFDARAFCQWLSQKEGVTIQVESAKKNAKKALVLWKL